MTIQYLKHLGPGKPFSTTRWLRRVLLSWDGGIWKTVWAEMTVLIVLWYALFAYSHLSHDADNKNFSNLIEFMRQYLGGTRTLLSFILVYFYQTVYTRAHTIFMGLPFPDKPFIAISTLLKNDTPEQRQLRRSVARYVLSNNFMIYHTIAACFRRDYPDPLEALHGLGLLSRREVSEINRRLKEFPSMGELAWMPMAWAGKATTEAWKNGAYHCDERGHSSADLQQELRDFRAVGGNLLFHVYLAPPLILVQVVTVMLYVHVMNLLLANQNSNWTEVHGKEPFFYFPFFSFFEILVFIGAFRVGQLFLDPLSGDDDDFEITQFWHRNLRLAHIHGLYGSDDFELFDGDTSVNLLQEQQVAENRWRLSLTARKAPGGPFRRTTIVNKNATLPFEQMEPDDDEPERRSTARESEMALLQTSHSQQQH